MWIEHEHDKNGYDRLVIKMVDIDKSSPEWLACVLREKKKLYMVTIKTAIAIIAILVPLPVVSIMLYGTWASAPPWTTVTLTGIDAILVTLIIGTVLEVLVVGICLFVDMYRSWLNQTAEEKCLERLAAKTTEGD